MIKYELGNVITYSDESQYKVENLYTLSQEEMKQHELYYPNRVRLQKLNGVGPEFIDCAITGKEE